MKKIKKISLYKIINLLKKFWRKKGCIIVQPVDIPVGAGTFHYHTFFNSINKKNCSFAYVQLSRRPTDGRYGYNPNRLQQYYQFQVIIKPPSENIQNIYIQSLNFLGINSKREDIRFIEDNWENPTLGAKGIGWEIWINGMEITQFTYFQKMGGIKCYPIIVEITYGLERLAMFIQNTKNFKKIVWDYQNKKKITYKKLFFSHEIEKSYYNFDFSNTKFLLSLFKKHLKEAKNLIKKKNPLIISSYEHILYCTHNFNLLDAKKILSSVQRQNYILKIRKIVKKIAKKYQNFKKK